MKLNERIYISVTNLLPRRYLEAIVRMARYAGQETKIKQWIGSVFLLGILLLIISLFAPLALYGQYSLRYLPFGIFGMLLCAFIAYALLYFKVQTRVDEAEGYLPDMLQLISVNLRAGLTPYAAIKIA